MPTLGFGFSKLGLSRHWAGQKEIGFPVFLTRRVFDAYVAVPPNVTCQDEAGRLWDIVSMLRFAIKSGRDAGDRIAYSLYVRNDSRSPVSGF